VCEGSSVRIHDEGVRALPVLETDAGFVLYDISPLVVEEAGSKAGTQETDTVRSYCRDSLFIDCLNVKI